VRAGDLLGEYYASNTHPLGDAPGYLSHEISASVGDPSVDPPPGTTKTYGPSTPGGYQIDGSAVLEADADHDGFGDETQDQCPTNGSTQGPCPSKKCKHKKKHKSGAVIAKKCKRKHH